MDQMFSAYGEVTPTDQPYCELKDISLEYIEQLARTQLENFREPEFIYLSTDLYCELMKMLGTGLRYSSAPQTQNTQPPTLMKIMTSAGSLEVKKVIGIENFCHVGSETSFQQLEWIKVSKAFEEVFFGEEPCE